jgi:hypothetical protein
MTDPSAGRSVQNEYERRAAKDLEQRKANRVRFIIWTIALTVGAFVAVVVLATVLNAGAPGAAKSMFSASIILTFAGAASFFTLIWCIKLFFGEKTTTVAYAKGAAGERATANLLAPLVDQGWIILPIAASRSGARTSTTSPSGRTASSSWKRRTGPAESSSLPVAFGVRVATKRRFSIKCGGRWPRSNRSWPPVGCHPWRSAPSCASTAPTSNDLARSQSAPIAPGACASPARRTSAARSPTARWFSTTPPSPGLPPSWTRTSRR